VIIASISWNQINVLVSSEESDFEANFLRVNTFPPTAFFQCGDQMKKYTLIIITMKGDSHVSIL
jgi:hypothetical protein